jgi:hypothetical protein
MPEMLTTDSGRNACRRPRAAPNTFAHGTVPSTSAFRFDDGVVRPKVRWLTIT